MYVWNIHYWNNTLHILTCQGIVGYIIAGKYVEEGIALFLELVIRPHQQFKRYDMEVSLYEAPCSLKPCHQNCENMTNCSSESFKQALDTFLKAIPDEPETHGYTYMRRADYNSLIHMTPLTTARHPSISEELDNMPHTI